MNLDLDNMDAEEQHELRQSSPFSLQALCRLSLMPGFTISDCPNRRFTRDALQHLGSDAAELIAALKTQAPRPFTREAFRHLGHAAKVNCLKSVAQVNIDRLDFSSVEQTDLENFLSVVKYNMNVTNDTIKGVDADIACIITCKTTLPLSAASSRSRISLIFLRKDSSQV